MCQIANENVSDCKLLRKKQKFNLEFTKKKFICIDKNEEQKRYNRNIIFATIDMTSNIMFAPH